MPQIVTEPTLSHTGKGETDSKLSEGKRQVGRGHTRLLCACLLSCFSLSSRWLSERSSGPASSSVLACLVQTRKHFVSARGCVPLQVHPPGRGEGTAKLRG